jgi:hypothetical protein
MADHIRPPLQPSARPSHHEPSPEDVEKLRSWQEERLQRKLRGEYESEILHLTELVRVHACTQESALTERTGKWQLGHAPQNILSPHQWCNTHKPVVPRLAAASPPRPFHSVFIRHPITPTNPPDRPSYHTCTLTHSHIYRPIPHTHSTHRQGRRWHRR